METSNDKDAAALLQFIDSLAYQSTVGKWLESAKVAAMRHAALTDNQVEMYRSQGAFRALDEFQLLIKDVVETHLKSQEKKVNKLLKENK